MKSRYLVVWVLIACSIACGGSDQTRGPVVPSPFTPPASPSPAPPPPPPPGEVTYTVLDGWTREPVPGAVVIANGENTRTDAAGQVRLMTTPPTCLRVEVLAPGFLERSTCALPDITLWPVLDSADREATRRAAFGWHDTLSTTGRMIPVGVNLGANGSRPDVLQVWRAAADEIRELTQGRITFTFDVVGFLEGTILVTPGTAEHCEKSNLKPTETFGFCWDPRYGGDGYIVLADRFEDYVVARRVLASVLIGLHPAPGVFNDSAPAHDFSTFERKTLWMIGQQPGHVRWPDFDQF
jgi:hypothetical protein